MKTNLKEPFWITYSVEEQTYSEIKNLKQSEVKITIQLFLK